MGTPASFAYCFNDAYALLAGVSLTSLLHNNPGLHPDVYCLVQEVSLENRERLRITATRYGARLIFLEAESLPLGDLPLQGHLASPMIYGRLLLSRLLPEAVDRLLYLDADTVVLGEVSSLFSLDIGDHCVAAVPDVAGDPMGRPLGLSPGQFFNAGVQLMNLPRWRAASVGERCIELLRAPDAAKRFPTLDQDAINLLLSGAYHRLDSTWNHAQYHKGEATVLGVPLRFTPATAETRIIQYLGRVKPHMVWYYGPGLEEFERYRAVSEWRTAALVPPTMVMDVADFADKLCALGRSMEAVALLKNGLATLADRLAQGPAG